LESPFASTTHSVFVHNAVPTAIPAAQARRGGSVSGLAVGVNVSHGPLGDEGKGEIKQADLPMDKRRQP
jgi:hypothetical protein